MGMGFDSCCGPKTSDEHTLAAETNGTGTAASDAELIDGPSGRSRGSKLRIGQRFSHKDDDGEEHLESHKQPRDKSDKTVELLKKAVKQDRVGGVLEDSQIEYIVRRMEYYTFQREEIVVEQGKVGTIFFVCEVGTMEVSVDGTVCNTLQPGLAFGGLALLYNCPRTATVKALSEVGVWGANGKTFRQVLQENAQARYRENRPFMEKIQIFDGLATKQKDKVAELFSTEVTENNARVLTEGHAVTAIYFVKEGQLRVWKGGSVDENGALVGGTETGSFQTGECFGDQAMYNSSPCSFTVLASGRCELLCISVEELKEVLGDDLKQCLEKSLVLQGLKQSPIMTHFSLTQQLAIFLAMKERYFGPDIRIQDALRFAVILDGSITGTINKNQPVTYARGQWYDDGSLMDASSGTSPSSGGSSSGRRRGVVARPEGLVAGPDGARLYILSSGDLGNVLKELGLSEEADQAIDATRKLVLVKKVPILRHLSTEQLNRLVTSFERRKYKRGDNVIKQGDMGTAFYVISSGEAMVSIVDERGEKKKIRVLGKNAYFGERALLFAEPRTATVEVTSTEAELWYIEKATFSEIVAGKMKAALMNRIMLQNTSVDLKDVAEVRIIGAGAAGIVRLVQHTQTKTKYALKRVQKQDGKIPDEVQRECDLLRMNDHPFIMTLVNVCETQNSVYMLTELITGGELHAAIRTIPTVLNKSQAQFYTGGLIIILEALADRNIVYRDLKPENVMLDEQGYLKLIDFGIAKKIEEGKSRTFTMIGTPHYMAPEVMTGHGYNTAVDLWSLGVILFEFVVGCLPFADDLDDPTEVCRQVLNQNLLFPTKYKDAPGRTVMQGLLCRQPKKRLGAGINGYEDVKNAAYFKMKDRDGDLFNKIMGRELEPPVVPPGEVYSDEFKDEVLSDAEELGVMD